MKLNRVNASVSAADPFAVRQWPESWADEKQRRKSGVWVC